MQKIHNFGLIFILSTLLLLSLVFADDGKTITANNNDIVTLMYNQLTHLNVNNHSFDATVGIVDPSKVTDGSAKIKISIDYMGNNALWEGLISVPNWLAMPTKKSDELAYYTITITDVNPDANTVSVKFAIDDHALTNDPTKQKDPILTLSGNSITFKLESNHIKPLGIPVVIYGNTEYNTFEITYERLFNPSKISDATQSGINLFLKYSSGSVQGISAKVGATNIVQFEDGKRYAITLLGIDTITYSALIKFDMLGDISSVSSTLTSTSSESTSTSTSSNVQTTSSSEITFGISLGETKKVTIQNLNYSIFYNGYSQDSTKIILSLNGKTFSFNNVGESRNLSNDKIPLVVNYMGLSDDKQKIVLKLFAGSGNLGNSASLQPNSVLNDVIVYDETPIQINFTKSRLISINGKLFELFYKEIIPGPIADSALFLIKGQNSNLEVKTEFNSPKTVSVDDQAIKLTIIGINSGYSVVVKIGKGNYDDVNNTLNSNPVQIQNNSISEQNSVSTNNNLSIKENFSENSTVTSMDNDITVRVELNKYKEITLKKNGFRVYYIGNIVSQDSLFMIKIIVQDKNKKNEIILNVGDNKIISINNKEYDLSLVRMEDSTSSIILKISELVKTKESSDDKKEFTNNSNVQKQTTKENNTINCNGCLLNNKCVPFGIRKSGQFCDLDGIFMDQFKEEIECNNNYECTSNVCINDKCIQGNFIQKFMNWLNGLFGK